MRLRRDEPLWPLAAALDHAEHGLDVWWRDDDAAEVHPRLDRLLTLAEAVEAPLMLAVIPAAFAPALVGRLRRQAQLSVAQHGWAHRNNARPGERKIELGGDRSAAALEPDLASGCRRLAVFGPLFDGWMVPPWNRIEPDVETLLPRLGFKVLSGLADAKSRPARGLVRIDVHVDCMAWRPEVRWIGLRSIALRLADFVTAGMAEPVGLLTHHLAIDAAALAELERLLTFLQGHARTRLVDMAQYWKAGRNQDAAVEGQ